MKSNLHSIHNNRGLLLVTAFALATIAIPRPAVAHDHAPAARSEGKPVAPARASVTAKDSATTKLPPLPAGVTEIKFGDFFVRPVGPAGLELTEKLRELDGRRVRILGYMVQQEEPPPGRLLLSPVPAQIHEHDNGLADDLPASTVFVSVPTSPHAPVPYAPGLMLLTGTLTVGSRTEQDGRISLVRLALDPPAKVGRRLLSQKNSSVPAGKGAERLATRPGRKDGSRL